MNFRLRDNVAREIFEFIKPSNPHGPQDDLYFGMPYCSHETEKARKIADRLLEKFKVVEDDTRLRTLIDKARENVTTALNNPNRQACTPGCPSGDHEHGPNDNESLLLQLSYAVESLLPSRPEPTDAMASLLQAISNARHEALTNNRASVTIDLDKLSPETDIDGNPIEDSQ